MRCLSKKKEKLSKSPVIVEAEAEIKAGGHVLEDEEETKGSGFIEVMYYIIFT